MNPIILGITLCIFSQVLFSSLYLFSYAMQPLTGSTIFALRIVVMMLGLWGLSLVSTNKQSIFSFIVNTLGKSFRRWVIMLLGTCILGSQLWIFMWAPINGEGLNVAMGYFLFPLVMVFAGKVVWQEKLSRLQLFALILAICGILHELYRTYAFSWATLWVVLLYPPYYLSRRIMNIPTLPGLTLDLTLIAPFAVLYLLPQQDVWQLISNEPRYWILLPLLGAVSALSMFFNILSSTILPMKLFGLLSYIEPALLFVISVTLLNIDMPVAAYITYGFIWSALGVLAINSFITPTAKKIKSIK
ncbi:EamA family transporter RarD [Gallibacterium trehalosifermentans]|uniref:EamA family transporter RarD n=1 Tax=Gallibacterium trehalosifermentans TaxID=516935 RepID=A0ABV6GZN6_9PAST